MSQNKSKNGKQTSRKLRDLTQELSVELTKDELLKRGKELAQIESQLREEEAHADAVKRELKAREGRITSERARLAEIVRSGKEPRPILVECWARIDEGIYEEVRTDTGEIVPGSRRRLTDSERQFEIPLDDATRAAVAIVHSEPTDAA